nr:MAG TPA: hypothetical protein [Caudoviricetes sp.]DAV74912.1 MAG TPA: hypothetical protein [Caudoviricetes sp.]
MQEGVCVTTAVTLLHTRNLQTNHHDYIISQKDR